MQYLYTPYYVSKIPTVVSCLAGPLVAWNFRWITGEKSHCKAFDGTAYPEEIRPAVRSMALDLPTFQSTCVSIARGGSGTIHPLCHCPPWPASVRGCVSSWGIWVIVLSTGLKFFDRPLATLISSGLSCCSARSAGKENVSWLALSPSFVCFPEPSGCASFCWFFRPHFLRPYGSSNHSSERLQLGDHRLGAFAVPDLHFSREHQRTKQRVCAYRLVWFDYDMNDFACDDCVSSERASSQVAGTWTNASMIDRMAYTFVDSFIKSRMHVRHC